ncbi:MAG: FkbM family methyltransferase [Bacteroidota bacterium]
MINKIKFDYKNNLLSKNDFISKMYDCHQNLFEYVPFLKETEIKSIEIVAGVGVIFNTLPNGIKLLCVNNDRRSAPFEIMNFDVYEKGDSYILHKLIMKDFTVLDIGANIGWYSMNISKQLESGNIICFEPIPNTFDILKQNIEINEFKNIEINNLGLSDKDGELIFYLSNNTSVSSSSENITQDQNSIEAKCRVMTLDNFLKNRLIKKIDFVKCDVEGAELFVYKGGRETIEKFKPIVFSEMLRKWSAAFGYHPNEIINFFKELNYSCFFTNNDYLKEIKVVVDETTATNFFFLHNEKHKNIIEKFKITI